MVSFLSTLHLYIKTSHTALNSTSISTWKDCAHFFLISLALTLILHSPDYAFNEHNHPPTRTLFLIHFARTLPRFIWTRSIEYLQEQRIGQATFLPLDSLKVPSPFSTERIRQLQNDGRYRLCSDVITCENESNRKAILYAVGNTVICDDIDAARELCFSPSGGASSSSSGGGGKFRVKAVTLNGCVISKAGNMTGGRIAEDSNKANRWSEQNVNALKNKKEKLEASKYTLVQSQSRGSSTSTVSSETPANLRTIIGNLRNRETYTVSDRTFTASKLNEQKSLLSATSAQVTSLKAGKFLPSPLSIDDLRPLSFCW